MSSRREAKRRAKKRRAEERELGGFKVLRPVSDLLSSLRDESNPNRKLHFDHYVTLLLFYWFNPVLDSLRGLKAAADFPRVRKKLGIPRSSLGSLSAAQHVFDADELGEVLSDLLERLPADKGDSRLKDLKEVITIADGTLFKALPRVAWALWLPEKNAVKAHVQFEVMREAPAKLAITEGSGNEKAVFERSLEKNRLYVLDSGYAKFSLFQAVRDAGSNFVCRLPGGWKHEVLEERSLTEADRKARVISDTTVELGGESRRQKQRLRRVVIEKVEEPSKRMRSERPVRETIVLATDRFDLPAELIAILYSRRWKIEIFFRWLKCTLGCRALVAESAGGAALQVYSALIACLLISLWTGKKPTKRTLEAICFYFSGLADAEDVLAHVERLKPHAS